MIVHVLNSSHQDISGEEVQQVIGVYSTRDLAFLAANENEEAALKHLPNAPSFWMDLFDVDGKRVGALSRRANGTWGMQLP